MERKSLCMTYFLWLVGGFFGIHHFYLRRDRQAFLWWMTWGGYFGIGWLTDLWMIPSYVNDSNEEKSYMEILANKMRLFPTPPRSFVRGTVAIMIGDGLGYIALGAIPVELLSERMVLLAELIVPLAVATGVHLVGNIGREQGAFKHALLGAYLTYPLYLSKQRSILITSVVSAYFFNKYGKQWRRTPEKQKSFMKRCFVLWICGCLYLSLWSSYLYFSVKLISENGEEIPLPEAAKHFFKSPLWNEFLSVMAQILDFAKQHGWKEVWQQIIIALDPQGKAYALKVFGLTDKATEQEISSRYRELSRQWHPDKHKDPFEKEKAQEKFIELASAYEILMKPYREARSTKNRDTSKEEL